MIHSNFRYKHLLVFNSILLFSIILIILLKEPVHAEYQIVENKYDLKEMPNNFSLKVGKEFFLDLDINDNKKYVFSDNTDLFNITKEAGEILFTPEQEGEFNVVVIALHDVNNFYFKVIKLKVEAP